MSLFLSGLSAQTDVKQAFRTPPESARPYTWYHWMNGNVSKEGITKDLESFKQTGVGGFTLFDINWFTPHGGVGYDSDEFHSALSYTIAEADRLGLEMGAHNSSGWSSTGAPWVTPEQSMKKLVWSEQQIEPGQRTITLKQPESLSAELIKLIGKNFYRDVAVLAFPTPENTEFRLDKWYTKILDDKKNEEVTGQRKSSIKDADFTPSFDTAPADAVISFDDVLNLSDKMDAAGKLEWSPKSGEWTVIRFGYTTTGKRNRPPSDGAKGLEIDKMSRSVAELYWTKYLNKVVDDAKGKKSLTSLLIDSYEVGQQNWTDGFDSEFKKRCGYDLIPRLVCVTGRILESTDYSERVLWDLRRTVADLTYENYFLFFTEKCHENGLKMECEPYGPGPFDASRVAQLVDIPMSECWQNKAHLPTRHAPGFEWATHISTSAAHLTGRKVVGAEAYTQIKGVWTMHPYVMKLTGDWAFTKGINRLYFHSSAHQPFRDEVKPGMTMGQFGFQNHRNNTWFSESGAWKEYLTRCQHILQTGDVVSDLLYLYGDERAFNNMLSHDEKGWIPVRKFDLADHGVLDRVSVDKAGIIWVEYEGKQLPNSYKMMVIKRASLMTVEMARKLGELAEKGAVVYAAKPVRTPRLHQFEQNDRALKALVKKYWDSGLIRDLARLDAGINSIAPDCELPEEMEFIHQKIDADDYYFLSNQTYNSRHEKVTFRVAGKIPELWDPETGETMLAPNWRITEDGRTQVDLALDPAESIFVVFREATDQRELVSPKMEYQEVAKLKGDWTVTFDPMFGPKKPQVFGELIAWNEHASEKIKYFSGTAAYRKSFTVTDPNAGLYLDLGEVDVMARVLVNGKDLGVLWKPPFHVNLSGALKKGKNELEIRVTNLWVNKLIGDSSLPETGKRSKWNKEAYESFPDWIISGQAAPPKGHRTTFATWNHYDEGGKLLPSGLMGPVRLMVIGKAGQL